MKDLKATFMIFDGFIYVNNEAVNLTGWSYINYESRYVFQVSDDFGDNKQDKEYDYIVIDIVDRDDIIIDHLSKVNNHIGSDGKMLAFEATYNKYYVNKDSYLTVDVLKEMEQNPKKEIQTKDQRIRQLNQEISCLEANIDYYKEKVKKLRKERKTRTRFIKAFKEMLLLFLTFDLILKDKD